LPKKALAKVLPKKAFVPRRDSLANFSGEKRLGVHTIAEKGAVFLPESHGQQF
jgi:hypothetical protein